jgi:hypothetical protein
MKRLAVLLMLSACSTEFHPDAPGSTTANYDFAMSPYSPSNQSPVPVATGDFVADGNGSIIGTIYNLQPLQLLDNSAVIWTIANLATAQIEPVYDSSTMVLGYTSDDCSGQAYAPELILLGDGTDQLGNGLTIYSPNDTSVYLVNTANYTNSPISNCEPGCGSSGSIYTDGQCVPNTDGNSNSVFDDFEAGAYTLAQINLLAFTPPLTTISQ